MAERRNSSLRSCIEAIVTRQHNRRPAMNRDYQEGKVATATFFTGIEIEHTPAYGKKTLFVVGVQDVDQINIFYNAHNCEHIFFGANHSFNPGLDLPNDINQWTVWEEMISSFLKKDILCSLDIPISHSEDFLEAGLAEYDNFIPQLRVVIPYIKQWNYNTMVKIDDKDFKASNPGVWSHSLHDLMNREKFTDWSKYKLDTIIE